MTKLSLLSSALTSLGSLEAANKIASLIKVAFTTEDEFRVVFNILLKGGAGADKVIGPLRHAMRQHKEMADKVLAGFTDEKRASILKALGQSSTNTGTKEPSQPYWADWNDVRHQSGSSYQDDWRIGLLKNSVYSIIAIGSRWLDSNYQAIADACRRYGWEFDPIANDLDSYSSFDRADLSPMTRKILLKAGISMPAEWDSELAVDTRKEIMRIYAETDAKKTQNGSEEQRIRNMHRRNDLGNQIHSMEKELRDRYRDLIVEGQRWLGSIRKNTPYTTHFNNCNFTPQIEQQIARYIDIYAEYQFLDHEADSWLKFCGDHKIPEGYDDQALLDAREGLYRLWKERDAIPY